MSRFCFPRDCLTIPTLAEPAPAFERTAHSGAVPYAPGGYGDSVLGQAVLCQRSTLFAWTALLAVGDLDHRDGVQVRVSNRCQKDGDVRASAHGSQPQRSAQGIAGSLCSSTLLVKVRRSALLRFALRFCPEVSARYQRFLVCFDTPILAGYLVLRKGL